MELNCISCNKITQCNINSRIIISQSGRFYTICYICNLKKNLVPPQRHNGC